MPHTCPVEATLAPASQTSGEVEAKSPKGLQFISSQCFLTNSSTWMRCLSSCNVHALLDKGPVPVVTTY